MANYNQSNEYFAALEGDEISRELMQKVDDWYAHLKISGIFSRMKKSYNYYFGLGKVGTGTSSEISQGGLQGELSLMRVNHYRNILQHMLVMTTSSRPTMDARAINTDYRSLAQTTLANGILDYYMREKRLEGYLKTATEHALIFGEGFIRFEWDSSQGEEFTLDPDTDEPVFSGDLRFTTMSPLDVIKDLYQEDYDQNDWVMVRHWKNRFDLIAKYPELEDEILSLETKNDDNGMSLSFYEKASNKSDLIPVYEFYHRKSDALPDGRQVVFLSSDVKLFDGPLPYKEIPVYRIAPANFIGTAHGYTTAFDLLSIQESIDALYSIVLTNQATFGTQNIMLPRGHGISLQSISGGLNLIEYDPTTGPPQSLNLTQTPGEIFSFMDKLERTMETISGVNQVARGDPQASLRSGNSLALIQSLAIQFNSGLQQSYASLLEDVGTGLLVTLRDFAAAPRVAMITGKNQRVYAKEFTGNELDKINRVVVDMGNPLAKTTSGKVQIAENMLQQGLIKTPQDYLMVIKTGNLDTMLEGQYAELMLIKEENEKLAEGEDIRAIATDDHKLHVQEHKSVLANSDVRNSDRPEDIAVVEKTLGHIQEHLKLLRETDPGLLGLIGEQSLAPQNPTAPKGGAGLDQLEPAEDALQLEGNPAVMDAAETGVQMPRSPQMPDNPLTGNDFDPETGGL